MWLCLSSCRGLFWEVVLNLTREHPSRSWSGAGAVVGKTEGGVSRGFPAWGAGEFRVVLQQRAANRVSFTSGLFAKTSSGRRACDASVSGTPVRSPRRERAFGEADTYLNPRAGRGNR